MVDIHVRRGTTASPGLVLDTLREASPERRQAFWSNVTPKYFKVHDSGHHYLEVTEGTFIVGRFWERSRYDWSQPSRVTATVLESNVFKPGSAFELRAAPGEDGRSEVEMSIHRCFQRRPKGWIAATVNHLGGRRLFGWYLGTVLKAVENEVGSHKGRRTGFLAGQAPRPPTAG